MGIALETTDLSAIAIGDTEIAAVSLGDVDLWSSGAAESSLNAEFGGGALPAGWTFVQNGQANATIDNSGECAEITIPPGTTSDSITSTGSSDATAGLVHSVSGDFDVAMRIATAFAGDDSTIMGLILRGAADAEMIRWTPYSAEHTVYIYGYARSVSGGSGTFVSGSGLAGTWLDNNPPWWRAKRVGNVYTFYASGDGVTWITQASVDIGVDAQTIKLGLGQYGDKLGLGIRIDKTVDLLALGGTDARDTVPTLYPANEVSTDFSTGLPAWLALDTRVDGLATLDTANNRVQLKSATADGSSGRLIYNGAETFDAAGVLMSYYVTGSSASPSYTAIGVAADDGAGSDIDVYAASPAYILEIADGYGGAVAVRVTRPLFINEFNEPYLYMDEASRTSIAEYTKTFIRVEKYGPRVRMRRWPASQAEPSTWDLYDGEDDTLRGLGPLVPYASVGHNPGAGYDENCVINIEEVEFYELTDTP